MGTAIRIAYIMGTLGSGGAERHLAHLLTRIDRTRFEPRLYLTRIAGEYLPPVQESGIPIEESGVRSVFNAEGAKGIVRLAERLRRERVDIVHSYLYGSNLIGMAVTAILPGVTHLISIRQQVLPLAPLFRSLFGVAAGPRTQFISVSVAADAVLESWGVDARWRHRVPNGVEVPEPWPSAQRAAYRASLGIDPDTALITMVANFHPVKGHAELIQALALLSREPEAWSVNGAKPGSPARRFAPQKARLLLVGTGKRLEDCRKLAARHGLADRVLFLGSRDDVPDLLRASDLFVLNSQSEGMSNALLEALAAGLPCVASDVGGNPELVRPGDNGFLVPPGRAEPLARVLGRLLADGELRARMGHRSRERAETEYGLEAMVHRTEQVYERVLQNRES